MKYSEFISILEPCNVPEYWNVYKDGVKLDKLDYELIKDLEVTKVELETCPYAIRGVIVHIYLEDNKK